MGTFCPYIVEAMANPAMLIEHGPLYVQDDRIRDAIRALYGIEDIIDENGWTHPTVRAIPTEHTILQVFEVLKPFLDPYADDSFTWEDVRGLIVNIVLYDALLDETFGLQEDLPATYDPSLLLELIGEARGFVAGNKTHHDLQNHNDSEFFVEELYDVTIDQTHGQGSVTHILHWASERLLHYFANQLGKGFVLASRDMNGNSYLHSYLKSAAFRILNPIFVVELLNNGFHPLDQNNDGETALHIILYASNKPFAHLTDAEIKANPKSQQVKRYKRFYQSMIHVFQDPDANIDIKNNYEYTVRHMLYDMPPVKRWIGEYDNEMNHSEKNDWPTYDLTNAREAYDKATGSKMAIERGRKQKLTEKILRLPKNITNRIRNNQGTNLERARTAIKQRQMNHTRRKKEIMHHELLNPAPSGGRRTKKRAYKKRSNKKRQTRR